MIFNVGFKFDNKTRAWLAGFLMTFSTAAAQAAPDTGQGVTQDVQSRHYELLTLDQIHEREEIAQKANDTQAYDEYRLAGDAIEDTIEGLRGSPNDLPPDFEDNLYTSDQGGARFKVIHPAADIDWTQYGVSEKVAKVKAEFVPEGTEVETIMADGFVETTKTAGADGGYRVINPDGEQYLVDKDKFEKLYDETETAGIYEPKPEPRKVVGLTQNVSFTAPWGEEMRIRKGGVLVHGGLNDIYGIQPDEFRKTYSAPKPPGAA